MWRGKALIEPGRTLSDGYTSRDGTQRLYDADGGTESRGK